MEFKIWLYTYTLKKNAGEKIGLDCRTNSVPSISISWPIKRIYWRWFKAVNNVHWKWNPFTWAVPFNSLQCAVILYNLVRTPPTWTSCSTKVESGIGQTQIMGPMRHNLFIQKLTYDRRVKEKGEFFWIS